MIKTAADGSVYDDGQPDFSWVEQNVEPLKITVTKQKPQWVDDSPEPLQNPEATPAEIAAYRTAKSVQRDKQPVNDDRFKAFGPANSNHPSYIMEPDLLETQQGMEFPEGLHQRDDGTFFYLDTPSQTVPMVRRPGILPIAATPEGLKFVTPKLLDLVGNVMGNVGGAASVPTKAGEMVLGSGIVKQTIEAAKNAEPFYSALERAVGNAKVGKADAATWLGYLRNQPGVKAEEINTVLKDLPEGQISKSDMEGLVKANAIKLEEKTLGADAEKARLRYRELSDKLHEKGLSDEEALEWKDLHSRDLSQETQYHQYQLPGGENYREMLVKLPVPKPNFEEWAKNWYNGLQSLSEKDIGKGTPWEELSPQGKADYIRATKEQYEQGGRHAPGTYSAPHFGDEGTNLLYHARMNDRNVEGNKTLHIEELQSDWHQKGRKEGYKLSPSEKVRLDENSQAVDEKLVNANAEDIMGNPDLKAGLEEAVKRKIISQKEADDYLHYTKNERSTVPDAPFKKNWDELALKRMIRHASENGYDAISWTPGEAQAARYDLSKQIKKIAYDPKRKTFAAWEANQADGVGPRIIKDKIELKDLADQIGKEAAEKLLNSPKSKTGVHTLEQADLKIGGEGMKAFYDKMLVDKANAIAKKYGGKVEQKNLSSPHKVMRAGPEDWRVVDAVNNQGFPRTFKTKELAQEYADSKGKQPIHFLRLTQSLKDKSLKEGFPLFSSSPILSPVTYNPFASEKQKRYKLIPVAGNPFTNE